MNKLLILFSLLISVPSLGIAQALNGLYAVSKVSMGERNMTPQAKWFEYKANGRYVGGNGWLRNDQGSIKKISGDSVLFLSDRTPADPYGAFAVSAGANGQMFLKRKEDGGVVTVTLVPTEDLPMGPMDLLVGQWQLEAQDSSDFQEVFLRWDRVYVALDQAGHRHTGYWHLHGHRPLLTLLPHQEERAAQRFRVQVEQERMIWQTSAGSKQEYRFSLDRSAR